MAKLKFFYSGVESNQECSPERVLKRPDVMVSYWNIYNRKEKIPSKRVAKDLMGKRRKDKHEN